MKMPWKCPFSNSRARSIQRWMVLKLEDHSLGCRQKPVLWSQEPEKRKHQVRRHRRYISKLAYEQISIKALTISFFFALAPFEIVVPFITAISLIQHPKAVALDSHAFEIAAP